VTNKRRDDAYQYMFCDSCRKRGYYTRKAARAGARTYHPNEKGVSVYECPEGTGMWHIGHLPRVVVERGTVARAAIFDSSYRRQP
jgi:hypothetical protein